MPDLPSLEQLRADVLAGRIDSAAARLTRVAERIQRIANETRATPSKGALIAFPYAFHGSEAIGEIIAALSNINLGGIASAASEADAAHITGE